MSSEAKLTKSIPHQIDNLSISRTPPNSTKTILLYIFGFYLINVAYLSSLSIQTVVFKKRDLELLGFYSVGIGYFFWGIGSVLSPLIVQKVGIRKSMILGGLSNTAYLVTSIIATWASDEEK